MARVFWNSFCGKSETDSQIILLSVNVFVEKTSFALSQTSVGHIVFHLFLAPPYLHQRTHLSCYKTESKNLLIPVTLYKVLKSGLVSFLVLFSDGGCFHLFSALHLLTVSSPVPPDTLLKFWWNWRSLGPLRWGDHDQSIQSSLHAGVSPWVYPLFSLCHQDIIAFLIRSVIYFAQATPEHFGATIVSVKILVSR